MSDSRAKRTRPSEEEERVQWARHERVRVARLQHDARRPIGELLEEGVQLSRFASELASASRRER